MKGIFSAQSSDFDELTNLWEASVRSTHTFLQETDIKALRLLIRHTWLEAVNLRVFREDDGKISGFIGVVDNRIEMLFVAPGAFGNGIGKQLLNFALENLAATEVDVNEQNPKALGFYLHQGFEIVGHSPFDGQGNPFPLLHLRYMPEYQVTSL